MRNIPPNYGIDINKNLYTLAYFNLSVARERGGSCHIELGRIFATALHGPYEVDLTQGSVRLYGHEAD